MNYFAEINIDNFVIALFTPHDEVIPVGAVEITEQAYAKVIASGEDPTDFQVDGTDLVLNVASQKNTIIKEKNKKVKEEAEKKILNIASDIKRNALMAESMVLLNDARLGRTLTSSEEVFLADNVNLENEAQAIRDASNLIEAEISAHADPLSYDIKASSLWPE